MSQRPADLMYDARGAIMRARTVLRQAHANIGDTLRAMHERESTDVGRIEELRHTQSTVQKIHDRLSHDASLLKEMINAKTETNHRPNRR